MQFRRSRDSSRAERPERSDRADRHVRPARVRGAHSRSGGIGPRMWVIGGLALAGVLLLVVGALALGKARAAAHIAEKPASPSVATTTLASTESSATSGTTDSSMVEVPSVVGLGLAEAKLMLESAGLTVVIHEAGAVTAAGQKQLVTSQEPAAGAFTQEGDTVRLVVPPASGAATVTAGDSAGGKGRKFVVCIDPGHQAHSNPTPEPIGPGATQTKPSVSGGATGVSTGIPEYEIALQIAMNLKKRLEAKGITVVMTRTVNDVDITNSARAAIATKAHADLFVRIHADGSPNSSVAGISTLYPASNKWTRSFAAQSKTAALAVQKALIGSTGAVNRGAVQRSDLSGFNWATVPSVLIESGFMSNRVEDKLLASPHYQDKIAEGISLGVQTYLQSAAR